MNNQNEIVEKRIYTIEEVTEILKVSRTSVYKLANSGIFKTVRIGAQYRISKKSFDNWLEGVNQ